LLTKYLIWLVVLGIWITLCAVIKQQKIAQSIFLAKKRKAVSDMASCKDCIHENVCNALIKSGCPYLDEEVPADAFCMEFRNTADVVPKSENIVELPCKVGDTVYRVKKRRGVWCILPREVVSITYRLDHLYRVVWEIFSTETDTLGKTVFLTEAEAEQALAKMKGGAE
jgi:hypothetical protein